MNICKLLIVAASLALASGSLQAGEKIACCKVDPCCVSSKPGCPSMNSKPLSCSLEMFQKGYLQTSKGPRLDTRRAASHNHSGCRPKEAKVCL